MSFLPTETYRGRVRARHANQGDVAVRVFSVVGASDPDAAMDAITSLFGIDINSPYDPDDENNVLLCESMVPGYDSAILQNVTCHFAVPPNGYFQATADPLSLPWRYEWGECVEQPEFDRDINNNAIVNAAGDPPGNPPTKTIIKKTCQIFVNEAFYDYATAKTYENTVSSDSITLVQPDGNSTTFPPGSIKCTSYKPARDYTQNDKHIPMVRSFEMYDPQDVSLTDPFQLHLLNKGSRGWYSDGGTAKKGNILDKQGNQVSEDVLLDGDGKPLDPDYTVEGKSPVANPDDLPDYVVVETAADSSVTWLLWPRYKSVPFTPIMAED